LRTLVVSDLHLGATHGRPALEDPAALAALSQAIAGADRLVLLGDIVELRELPLQDALAAASRTLPELASALGPGSELIISPGNHDHELLTHPEAMAEVVRALGSSGADVRVEYPGVWLREDVYAHHGHYLDRHTRTPAFERLAAGAMGRFVKLSASETKDAQDYERVLAPIYAWMFALTQSGAGEVDSSEGGGSMRLLNRLREGHTMEVLALQAGVRSLVAALSVTIGPLSGDLSDRQIRRASLSAYGEVLQALDLQPTYALFGHTHRAGPLRGDDAGEWFTSDGIQLMNTGCWVRERFVLEGMKHSPYRPGFVVELDDSGPPRLVNLLDG
jgi:hypothetical protein